MIRRYAIYCGDHSCPDRLAGREFQLITAGDAESLRNADGGYCLPPDVEGVLPDDGTVWQCSRH